MSKPDNTAARHLDLIRRRLLPHGRVNGDRYFHRHHDHSGTRTRVLSTYSPETSMGDAARLIDFDRALRMLVLEGVERIEIALRTQLGYSLGSLSPFAHEDGVAKDHGTMSTHQVFNGALVPGAQLLDQARVI